MMDKRENLLVALRGGKPDYVPSLLRDSFFFCPSILQVPDSILYGMLFGMLEEGVEPTEPIQAPDCFGIQWILDDMGPFPVPGQVLFEEIEDWREGLTIPSTEGYDWDADVAENKAIIWEDDKASLMLFYGLFTTLNNAMGFVNSLVAIAEDPEEVQKCFEAICDFYCEVIEQVMSRVRIDIIQICDDVANNDALFINPDYYREALKPLHKRMFDTARKMNPDVVLEMHCCGDCHQIIDDFVEIGSQAWEPAEPQNDLAAVQAKHGTNLCIVGGNNNQVLSGDPSLTEAQVREYVDKVITDLGSNGSFVYFNMVLPNTEMTTERTAWIDDEVETFGGPDFYK